jgi:hypothetical protein
MAVALGPPRNECRGSNWSCDLVYSPARHSQRIPQEMETVDEITIPPKAIDIEPTASDELEPIAPTERGSTQQTAGRAVDLLLRLDKTFRRVGPAERRALAKAFAGAGKVVYGKAFDIAKVLGDGIDLTSDQSIEANMDKIVLYEIKSTNRRAIDSGFKGYFFSLSTAELLVAQSLEERFKFVFVNVETQHRKEMSLREIFAQARAIYPVWSISFGDDPAAHKPVD